MISDTNNSQEVLMFAKQEGLYEKLLQQLEKDFILANTPINITEDIKSLDLEALIREKVYYLLVEQLFDVYLNLLLRG